MQKRKVIECSQYALRQKKNYYECKRNIKICKIDRMWYHTKKFLKGKIREIDEIAQYKNMASKYVAWCFIAMRRMQT